MNRSSLILPSATLLARRRGFGVAMLSASAVALLGGRDALAAGAKTDAKQHEADVRILNTALAAEYEAIAAYQAAAGKLQALMEQSGVGEDELVAEFDAARRAAREEARAVTSAS